MSIPLAQAQSDELPAHYNGSLGFHNTTAPQSATAITAKRPAIEAVLIDN
jgi:hypothetical protein